MFKKHFVSAAAAFCIMLFAVPFSLTAQDDSGEWYYDKLIRNIGFENLKSVKRGDLEGVTSSFAGKPFTDDLISSLYDRMFGLEYFDDVEIKVAKGSDNGKTVNLIISVHERPVVSKITFSGNRQIHTSTLKEQISVKEKDVFVESKLLVDERAIRNHYIEKGYTKVSVTASHEERNDGSIGITFKISEGRQSVIKEISFEGNNVISEKMLKSKISLKQASLFQKGAFQEASLTADSKAIVAYYKNRGYVDARVMDVRQESEYNEKKRREEINVIFTVQEGAVYSFGGIDFVGNHVFTTDELSTYVRLKNGERYNETKYQETVAGVQNHYFENGYTSNRFSPELKKDIENRVVSYVLNIEEHPRSHVEKILVKGNEKTKDYVIRREIPIDEGDIFSNAKIQNGMRNLYNLQYFSAVNPDVVQGSEENLVDLVFSVEEQSTTSLDFGFTFSGVTDPSDFPIALYAKIQESNLFGEGKSVSAGTTLSTDEQSITLGYGQNWLMGLPINTNLSLSFAHANRYGLRLFDEPNGDDNDDYYYLKYEQYSFSLGLSLGHRWTPNFAIMTLSGGITSSVIDNIYNGSYWTPYDPSVTQYADNWEPKNSLWTSFSVDARNIAHDATRGWFASQKVSWYGLLPEGILAFAPEWGEKEFYLRTDTKAEKYFTLFNLQLKESYNLKVVLMGYTGLSFQIPVGDTVIKQNNQLYIDGMFNGRGWTIYNYSYGRGKSMWQNTLELRVPVVPGVLSIDGWFDACAVKQETNGLFSSLGMEDWYFSFGPSIRFLIPQFPLRLLFCNTFKVENGDVVWYNQRCTESTDSWYDNWHFVLSFNFTNR